MWGLLAAVSTGLGPRVDVVPGRTRKGDIRASGAGQVLQGYTLTYAVPAPVEMWSQATRDPQQPQCAQSWGGPFAIPTLWEPSLHVGQASATL